MHEHDDEQDEDTESTSSHWDTAYGVASCYPSAFRKFNLSYLVDHFRSQITCPAIVYVLFIVLKHRAYFTGVQLDCIIILNVACDGESSCVP